MTNLRYNRVFKKGIAGILFCLTLFGSIVAFFITFKIQYNQLVSNMESIGATITDVENHYRRKGLYWQEIYVEYEVDGIVYNRELKTDTAISFNAGDGAHYSVGDNVQILYDPQNPEIIASPRTVGVGYFWLIFSLLSLSLVIFALCWMIKSRQKYLVTQEEYDQEGEEIKRSKLAKKEKKKQKRLERKSKHPKARKIGKIILIILGSLAGIFILYLLFGLLLISLGYGS